MCTICGHFSQNGRIRSTDIYDMLKKMAHRGPDTHGVYLDGKLLRVDRIEELKKQFEFIIIDAPPALGVADARVLGAVCDAIMVVVLASKTNRDAVLEVKEELERSGVRIIGFVLNGVDFNRHYYRDHYYYYSHK